MLSIVLAMSGLAVGMTSPAVAAPVYELEGEWEAGTPGQPGVADPNVAKGDVVTAVWRVNVNSDLPAPTNEPVDNVTASVTLVNGVFANLPDVCFTGGAYTPQSSLSADKKTLTCNIGTVNEGTAVVLQTAIVADGPTGSNITATGSFNGQTVELPPVPIVNTFGMDMLWGTPTGTVIHHGGGTANFDFEWTLFQDAGSDAGPDTVTYDLSVELGTDQELFLGTQANYEPWNHPCTPLNQSASGHPYSAGYGAVDSQAPFPTCTLTKLGFNAVTGVSTFRLTLSDIDYSQTLSPTRDSAGQPLPANQVAVATGSIWLQLRNQTQSTGATLTSTAPTYTSVSNLIAQDNPTNNTSSKTIVLPGGWSHAYGRITGGTPWDNTYEQPAGAMIWSSNHHIYGLVDNPPATQQAVCDVLDTQFVTYERIQLNAWEPGDPQQIADPFFGTYQWYVGNDPTVTPGSGSYDPNAFTGCGGTTGWVNVEPADKSTVKAVRWTSTNAAVDDREIAMYVFQQIKPTAPIGQDIWTFGSFMQDGVWYHFGRETVPADQTNVDIAPTPNSRYPYTTGARDKVRVVYALPSIAKKVDRAQVRPGVPATFTLTYSANGAGSIPPTVDDYQIVDVLPVGMTYETGSATPAPSNITTNGAGQQVLTWDLDDVATNVANTLTYQAVVGPNVDPGVTLVNTVTSSLAGETSRPATAQVTTSTNGYTQVSKSADTPFIANLDGSGDGEGSWTVTMRSFDPRPQAFTDVIDVLPWEGDERGTDFDGDYELSEVEILGATAGSTVYYTTADPASLSDNPREAVNGSAAGSVVGNTSGWTTTFTPDATAVRVIGPSLAPGAMRQFRVHIVTEGASPEDSYVNRAQGNAGHTRLVMRTSAPMVMAPFYSANLKKYVLDLQGNWRDAQDVTDYPAFKYGDTVRFRIVVTNTGQGTLNNVVLADDKQPELGEFTIDSLASGQSQTHEYSFVLDEASAGTVVNTACASADVPANSGTTVPPQINCDPAGFQVTNYTTVKSSVPTELSSVKPGDKVTYTVKVTQEGDAAANAEFSDNLSDVLDDATYNGDATADIGTVQVQGAGLSWSGVIPDNQVATITYSVTVKSVAKLDAEGNFGLKNVVASPGCNPKAGQDADCKTGHDVGAYTYSKTSDPKSGTKVAIGNTVTYSVQVVHKGRAAVPGATLSDDLSAVLDDARYNGDATATSGAVSVSGNALTWNGDLAVGATATITYSVEVIETGDRTMRNVVSSNDPRSACVRAPDQNPDCTTTHTKREFDLLINKRVISGPRATVGDDVRYRLTVKNQGPDTALGPIKVVDRLPHGLELVSAKGKGWKCVVKKMTDTVVCKRKAGLKDGAKAPSITVVATTTRAATGRLVNVATVSAQGDTEVSNNKGKAVVEVKGQALPQTGFRIATERDTWLGGLAR